MSDCWSDAFEVDSSLKPQQNRSRLLITLDGRWEYSTAGEISPGSEFIPEGFIAVPASWNEQLPFLYHYNGRLWYQKRFELPELKKSQRVLLRFSGLLYRGEFFLNGQKIGEDRLGLLPKAFDITRLLEPGCNLLTVAVDGKTGSDQPVGCGDFYTFAGIHRPVVLQIVDEKHIESVKVQTSHTGKLSVSCRCSGGVRAEASINNTVFSLPVNGEAADHQINGIVPWDCSNPVLYPLTIKLFDAEDVLRDSYTLKIGFRSIRICGRKILLNDQEFKLRGFGRHEDFFVTGKGMNHALNIHDFELMRYCGGNSFRTTHYPYSEEMMELADECGFAVIDEAPFVDMNETHFNNPQLSKDAVTFVEKLIERDRNHPCVISWSMGNECKSDVPEAVGFFTPIFKAARKADPSRPLIYVADTREGEDLIYPMADIIGINRYFGWYEYIRWGRPVSPGDLNTAVIELDKCIDRFAKIYPQPLVMTEFGADCVAGLHSLQAPQFTEEFQAEFLRRYIICMEKREEIAGMHVWNLTDFSTCQNPFRVVGNRKGIFTRAREPKAAAFAVKSLWNPEGCPDLNILDESARAEKLKWSFLHI